MSEAVDPEAVAGLAAKLEGLDLTTGERAVLDGVLARAAGADDEVEGFGVVYEIETTDVKSGQPMGAQRTARNEWVTKVGRAAGVDFGTLGVWTDMRP